MEAAHLARCSACAKSYRVPHADRSYRCKSCGGVLTVEGGAPAQVAAQASTPTPAPTPAPSAVLSEERACPECHALQVKPESFCAECGAALDGGMSGRTQAERVERRQVAEEMRRAAKLLRFPRLLLLLAFIFNLMAAIGVAISLADSETDTAAALVVTAVSAAVSAVSWVAYFLIRYQPLLWSLLPACMSTLSAVISVLEQLEEDARVSKLTVLLVVRGVWLLFMWWVVFAGAKLQRLRRLHPDLYATAVLADAVPTSARRKARGAAERALQIQDHARHKAARNALTAGALIVVLPAVLAGVLATAFRTEPLSTMSEGFATAWSAGDVDALEQLCVTSDAPALRSRLERMAAANAWPAGKWPELELSRESVDGGDGELASTMFELPDEANVGVGWRRTARGWKVFKLVLPSPPIDARAEEFVQAWKSGVLEQLVALFPEVLREERTRSTERFLDKFDWPASKDTISVRRTQRLRNDRVEVTFEVAGGRTLDAYFEADDELVWWLKSVRSNVR